MTDRVADTLITAPRKLPAAGRESCLVHIYPTGTNMGRRYPLGREAVQIGRGEDNDIRIEDHSVSRRHARVHPSPDGFFVADLGSTNGTFVDDVQLTGPMPLYDGCFLRVGNCIFKFLTGGNIEAHYHEEIYRLTIIDGLTEIHNQRYLLDFLDRELARSLRYARPLSVLMFDLDRFKSVNDQFGHLCGDFVLRELSRRLKGHVRREDLFARYGGEEFSVVLVETGRSQAVEVAERIRRTVADQPFRFEEQTLNLTVSLGVGTTPGGEAGLSPQALLHRADEKLYEAKAGGRNRVVS